MEENKIKKFGFKLGSFLASVCAICLSTCFIAVVVALTYRFVAWILGGIV